MGGRTRDWLRVDASHVPSYFIDCFSQSTNGLKCKQNRLESLISHEMASCKGHLGPLESTEIPAQEANGASH